MAETSTVSLTHQRIRITKVCPQDPELSNLVHKELSYPDRLGGGGCYINAMRIN